MQVMPAAAAPAPAAAPSFGSALAFGSPPAGAPMGGAAGSGSASGTAKLGFAAVLHGFSADDLGFNPAMVPAWITCQVPASTLKDQISSGTVMIELGALIDGISDVGFRNTLSGAKRGLQVKLPQNEVFHALTDSAPAMPSAAVGASATPKPMLQPASGMGGAPMGGQSAFVIQPGAPAGQVSRVEPAGNPALAAAAPSFFTAGPPAGAAPAGAPESPFGQQPGQPNPFAQQAEAAPAPAPMPMTAFGQPPAAAPAPAPAAAAPSLFGSPAPVSAPSSVTLQPAIQSAFGTPSASMLAAVTAATSSLAAVSAPAPAPAPAPAAAPFTFPQAPAATPAQPPSGMFKPMTGAAVSAFGTPPPPAAPGTGSLGLAHRPFDPFASSGTGALPGVAGAGQSRPTSTLTPMPVPPESGFSSAQLLGATAHLPAFSTPPVLQPKPAEPAPAPASGFGSGAGMASAFASPFGAPPAAAAAAAAPAQPAFVPPSFAPALEARPASIPLFSEPVPAQASAAATASRPLFGEAKPSAFGSTPAPAPVSAFGAAPVPAAPSLFGSAAAPAAPSTFGSVPAAAVSAFAPAGAAAAPAPAASVSPTTALAAAGKAGAGAKHSFLGLAPLDTQTDQLLLRALLGTEENLTPQRVVELLACHPGLSACVCLQGTQVLSHADRAKPDAADFQRQAPDIARQLRGLAPLIGIDGAETFTLNAGNRLITFCFPGSATVGVLHDEEPSTGLRDKITLIARELTRMLG